MYTVYIYILAIRYMYCTILYGYILRAQAVFKLYIYLIKAIEIIDLLKTYECVFKSLMGKKKVKEPLPEV